MIFPANLSYDIIRQVALNLVAVFFFTLPVHSQQPDSCIAGVFIDENDFINNDLSYKINTVAKDHKLTFTFPADFTLTLKLVTPDTSFKFPPGSIYGFSECGSIYRYYHGGKELNAQEDFYKIEEAGGLIIYSSVFVSGDEVFYGKSLTSSIRRLTLRNLKEDFGSYPNFIDELEKKKLRLAERDETGFHIVDLYERMVSAKSF